MMTNRTCGARRSCSTPADAESSSFTLARIDSNHRGAYAIEFARVRRRRNLYQIRGTRCIGPGGAGSESLCTEAIFQSCPNRRRISSSEAPVGPMPRSRCANASNSVAPGAASSLTPPHVTVTCSG